MTGLDRWILDGPRDAPEPDEPRLEPVDDDRCNACGELPCERCGGCTVITCQGDLCQCPGIPLDRWQAALDDAADAEVDDAKFKERVS